MAVYILNRPASSAVVTMKFNSYNAAVDFFKRSGMLQPSKPYKRHIFKDDEIVQVWCVTLPNMNPSEATFTKREEPKKQAVKPAKRTAKRLQDMRELCAA